MATTKTSPIVFMSSCNGDGEAACWRQAADAPGVVRYGPDDFMQVQAGQGVRAYVNGFPVIGDPVGLQILQPGDLVRVFAGEGASTSFVYAGRSAPATVAGAGQTCAFTGMPIEGRAVCCPACGDVVGEDVVTQIGQCACGHGLRSEEQVDTPVEELL